MMREIGFTYFTFSTHSMSFRIVLQYWAQLRIDLLSSITCKSVACLVYLCLSMFIYVYLCLSMFI